MKTKLIEDISNVVSFIYILRIFNLRCNLRWNLLTLE